MKTSDFDYDLPTGLIAQTPAERRDHSRLMVLSWGNGALSHHRFYEVVEYLRPGDVLVLNDSRVIPARLLGRKERSGGGVEVLLLHRLEDGVWEALLRPARRLGPGTNIELSADGGVSLSARVLERGDGGVGIVRLSDESALQAVGKVPLPPYIRRPIEDPARYQTVYARAEGSVAAPTAGLHFTPDLLRAIAEKGVRLAFVTLHVGLASFRPVQADDPREHNLHTEYFEVGPDAAGEIARAREEGGRVVCVGTTAARVLEQAALSGEGEVRPMKGWADIYILPGHRFMAVDALITNFHLPRSTLLMLVAAFAGRERVLSAYGEAVRFGYRFYSFGDCMLIT
ncbi:tRNA preQ1(34) S-adenosylmethionine ribosyltransferase-isomerase QueA [Chloroflexota bacterium]